MKANNANRSINNQSEIQTVKPAFGRITAKPKLAPYGTEPVVINFAAVLPPCYANYNNAIFVDGPRCEGTSGRSHLEEIPPCVSGGASATSKTKPVAAVPSSQPESGTRTQEQRVTTQKTGEQRAVSDIKKTTLSAPVEATGEKS